MAISIKELSDKYHSINRWIYLSTISKTTPILFFVGLILLVGGLNGVALSQGGGPTGSFQTFSEAAYEDDLVRNAVGNLFKLIEGAFGALIMVFAGLGAIVAASMGAYKAAVSLIVVSVGAFILRSLVSLFFGADYIDFEAN